jgi:hypothetical protein
VRAKLATQASTILLGLLIPSSGSGKVADREGMSFLLNELPATKKHQ